MSENSKFQKLDLMSILKLWNDNGGNVRAIIDALGITEQIPVLIAGIPPEAQKTIADMLAPYLPAPNIETKAIVDIMLPILSAQVAKMNPGTADITKLTKVVIDHLAPLMKATIDEEIAKLPPISPENINEVADIVRVGLASQYAGTNAEIKSQIESIAYGLKKLQDELKKLQDELESKVRALTEVTFKAELEKARAESEKIFAAGGGEIYPPSPGAGVSTPQGTYGIVMAAIDKLLNALPTIADAYAKFRPAPAGDVGAKVLQSYISGLTSGNKLRIGEAQPADIAKEALDIIQPKK